MSNGVVDFSAGRYYDQFHEEDELSAAHMCGLDQEVVGATTRAAYYRRLIRDRLSLGRVRVLDCGCGNGLTVETLRADGLDAWGNDLSTLRKWQWRDRTAREYLVVADGSRLPFPSGFFDFIICSGVLEHVGVDEIGAPSYTVTPRPSRDEERRRFLAELFRVSTPNACLFLDFPNGAFPIDFWHGGVPGGARIHRFDEGFLPKIGYVRRLVHQLLPGARLTPLSPADRLQFRQVSAHWYGRLFAPLVSGLFHMMRFPGLRWLAGTAINPFLVVEVRPHPGEP